jgi:hypothetical protein
MPELNLELRPPGRPVAPYKARGRYTSAMARERGALTGRGAGDAPATRLREIVSRDVV